MVGFIDAACVHPEIFQAVFLSLSAAKLKFCITSLTPARLILYIAEDNLLIVILVPSMRENRVAWCIVAEVLVQADFTMAAQFQKAHRSMLISRPKEAHLCSRQDQSIMKSTVMAGYDVIMRCCLYGKGYERCGL
jgi:hypothetical protein